MDIGCPSESKFGGSRDDFDFDVESSLGADGLSWGKNPL